MSEESTAPEQEAVVLASFESRRDGERMLASLGRDFRKKARKGEARVFVISGNKDGSLKITESRVLQAGDFSAAVIRISASWAIGFMGVFATLKSSRGGVRAVRKHHGHVGADEARAHELLAEVGPHAALALIRCKDDELGQVVAARAAERGAAAWDGSLATFLSALDAGSQHDWVRAALGEAGNDR